MGRLDVKRASHRILIVDDHPVVREGFARVLEEEPGLTVCGQADTMKQALELVGQLQPELVMVDLSLEDGSGLALITRLKRRWPDLKMLVCSIHDEALFAERAIAAGALGYLNKQETTHRIKEAVRTVLAGELYLSAGMSERVSMGCLDAKGAMPASIAQLSNREIEVFDLIGQGLSTADIAARLNRSVKTIETHRDKIKRKLHLASGGELVRRAVQWQLEQR